MFLLIMAEWDKFEINNYGKVIITKINGERLKRRLDIIKLGELRYFVDKEYLKGLNEFSQETLMDTPIYSLVGTDLGSKGRRGITIELREGKRPEGLDIFIKEINSTKNIQNFLS